MLAFQTEMTPLRHPQASKPETSKGVGPWRIFGGLILLCVIGFGIFLGTDQGIEFIQPKEEISLIVADDASRFYMINELGTWKNMKSACEGTGGQLASIHSAADNAQVNAVCTGKPGCFVGLNDAKVKGKWVWTDGTPYDYANWYKNQPSNQGCVVQLKTKGRKNGKWVTLPCSATSHAGAVCEKVSKIKKYLCPAGLFLLKKSPTACVCKKCPAGSKCKGGTSKPVKCPKGTFQHSSGQNECMPAPPGKYVDAKGQKLPKLCKKGHMCPGKGTKWPIPCNYGEFQPGKGKTKCKKANAGHYVPRRGSAKQTKCPVNTFQSCSGQKTCIECPVGKKILKTGSTSC